jgi:hypothetical protein
MAARLEAHGTVRLRQSRFFSLVLDNLNAPRVEPGEHVQIDPSDREPIDGKLFMVGWNDGRRSIVQLRAVADGAWEFGFVNDPARHGPYGEGELPGRIIGRVVATITHTPDLGGDKPLVASFEPPRETSRKSIAATELNKGLIVDLINYRRFR